MTTRFVDDERLDREVRERLREHVPSGAETAFSLGYGWEVPDDAPWEGALVDRVEYALTLLEDHILVDITHKMWPQGAGQGPSDPPRNEPHAEIRDGGLHVWWGDRDAPVLALDPIPVDTFLRSA